MRPSRRIVVTALVVTAMCADRVAIAAPTVRPQVAETARQIVIRLARSFRQSVPAVRLQQARREATPAPVGLACPGDRPASVHIPLHPQQHRLPPPTLL